MFQADFLYLLNSFLLYATEMRLKSNSLFALIKLHRSTLYVNHSFILTLFLEYYYTPLHGFLKDWTLRCFCFFFKQSQNVLERRKPFLYAYKYHYISDKVLKMFYIGIAKPSFFIIFNCLRLLQVCFNPFALRMFIFCKIYPFWVQKGLSYIYHTMLECIPTYYVQTFY